jgi:hypothetical protein
LEHRTQYRMHGIGIPASPPHDDATAATIMRSSCSYSRTPRAFIVAAAAHHSSVLDVVGGSGGVVVVLGTR